MNSFISIIAVTLWCLIATPTYSQADCKVLDEKINTSYTGDCKKGLAHGKGTAKGKDSYEGHFKKGQPHGKGTYTYANGSSYIGNLKEGKRHGDGRFDDHEGGRYIGDWKADMKHGEGKYFLKINEQDTILAGLWKEDKYLGPKPEKPYVITLNRGVDRTSMFRIADGNRLTVKIMQNGGVNDSVTDYRFTWSSGTELMISNGWAWENIEYPFEGRITYRTANKLKTATYTVTLEFIINEPGFWELVLHN